MRPRIQLEVLLRTAKLALAGALAWLLARGLDSDAHAALLCALFAALLVQSGRRFFGLQAVSRLFLLVMSGVVLACLRALLGSPALSLLVALPLLALLLQRFRTVHAAPWAFLTVWWLSSQPAMSSEGPQVVALGLAVAIAVDGCVHMCTLPWAAAMDARALRTLGRELAEVGEQVGSAVLAPNVRALRDAGKRLLALNAGLAEVPGAGRCALALDEAARRLGQLAAAAIELRDLRLPPQSVTEPPSAALGAALTDWARALRGCLDGRPPRPQSLSALADELARLAAETPALRGLAFDLRSLELCLADLAASLDRGPREHV